MRKIIRVLVILVCLHSVVAIKCNGQIKESYYTEEELKEQEELYGDKTFGELLIDRSIADGSLNERGFTAQKIRNARLLPEEYAKRKGYIKDEKGFYEGFVDSINRTSRQIAGGFLRIFGTDVRADIIEERLARRKDLDQVKLSDGCLGWLGDKLGCATTWAFPVFCIGGAIFIYRKKTKTRRGSD